MSTVVRPNYGTKGTDNITDLAELEGLLSPFQVEKLTYFFNQFFDFNEDGKIDVSSPFIFKVGVNFEVFQAADFAGLNERLRKVAGWGEEDQEYINMVDNNRVFFECLLEQVCKVLKTHLNVGCSGVGGEEQGGSRGEELGRGSCPQVLNLCPSCPHVANSLEPNNRCVHKALT